MLKRENHVTIHGWMIADLHLHGLDLFLYAIIFSFSQFGSDFHGKISYLQEWTEASRMGIYKSLKKLCDLGYIRKWESDGHICYDYNPYVIRDIFMHGS